MLEDFYESVSSVQHIIFSNKPTISVESYIIVFRRNTYNRQSLRHYVYQTTSKKLKYTFKIYLCLGDEKCSLQFNCEELDEIENKFLMKKFR